MLRRRVLSRDPAQASVKKRETTSAREYVRFYHFDAHAYSSRGDVHIPFHRTARVCLRSARRARAQTSLHDAATGGGINYLPSRVISPRSREAFLAEKSDFARTREKQLRRGESREARVFLFSFFPPFSPSSSRDLHTRSYKQALARAILLDLTPFHRSYFMRRDCRPCTRPIADPAASPRPKGEKYYPPVLHSLSLLLSHPLGYFLHIYPARGVKLRSS